MSEGVRLKRVQGLSGDYLMVGKVVQHRLCEKLLEGAVGIIDVRELIVRP